MRESDRQQALYHSLRVADVAAECGVTPSQVYGWIADGELRALDVRSKGAKQAEWRIRRDALDDFLRRRTTHAA